VKKGEGEKETAVPPPIQRQDEATAKESDQKPKPVSQSAKPSKPPAPATPGSSLAARLLEKKRQQEDDT
jgi:hypothetical protein